jgi:hypothetical protein
MKSPNCLALERESGCAVLLASVSFEVGAVWRDGHAGTVASSADPLDLYQP